ncbi:MAG: two-component response regulator MtrA [Actinomycetota bacterium]
MECAPRLQHGREVNRNRWAQGGAWTHRFSAPTVLASFDASGPKVCVFCNNLPWSGRMRCMATLLFIEDDPNIRTALRLSLEDEGYRVEEAPDGEAGIKAFPQVRPDLVLLDLRLPDMSGFEVCRALRRLSTVPIIIVTAQTDTHDLVVGLEAGADDYVTKPVNTKELAARIRASIRRTHLAGSGGIGSVSTFGGIEVRRDLSVVLKGGVEISLTRTEYDLLCEFADHPNMVLSRDQLLERVWGYEYLGDSRLVDAHIRRLRVKIEDQPDSPKLIATVRGMGYRLLVNATDRAGS